MILILSNVSPSGVGVEFVEPTHIQLLSPCCSAAFVAFEGHTACSDCLENFDEAEEELDAALTLQVSLNQWKGFERTYNNWLQRALGYPGEDEVVLSIA